MSVTQLVPLSGFTSTPGIIVVPHEADMLDAGSWAASSTTELQSIPSQFFKVPTLRYLVVKCLYHPPSALKCSGDNWSSVKPNLLASSAFNDTVAMAHVVSLPAQSFP